jgi:hypothetical protein
MQSRRKFLSALASLAAAAGLSRFAPGAAKAAEPAPPRIPQPGDPHPAPHLRIRYWHANVAEYQSDGTYKVRVHYEAVDERGNVTPLGSKLVLPPEMP